MSSKSSDVQKKFGEKIRQERTKIGLSQEELGFKASLDRTYISGIERGERNPSLKIIVKVAKALKTPTFELFKLR
ncbi:helix-turn-helix transcriptional regulator [Patescibacteria group bacterium]|nr:helix-turn-helix transcriptional regulator [Patescibacteria group bacterium]